MRTFPMKRMPVTIRSSGLSAVVLDMDLPDDAFGADGQPRNGYVIVDGTRCWVESSDMGRVSRRQMMFGELDLA